MADNELKIGYRLQKARREKKINLSLAAKDLCIPQKYLSAFEKNDTTALPEPIYAVGFMRTYADYLGLDPDPLVDTLKANFNQEPGNPGEVAPPRRSGTTALGVLLFLALGASLGYFGFTTMAEPNYTVAKAGDLPEHIATLLENESDTRASSQKSE